MQGGRNDFQSHTRETSPRAHVGEPTFPQGHDQGGKHGFTKMTVQDLQGIPNTRQIELLVPGKQQLQVRLDLYDLRRADRDPKIGEDSADYLVRGYSSGRFGHRRGLRKEVARQGPLLVGEDDVTGFPAKYLGPAIPATTSVAACQQATGRMLP